MTITGTIEQAPKNAYYLTDALAGDIMFRSLCNINWMFGGGSNTTSVMRINSNLVSVNSSTVTVSGNMGVSNINPQYTLDVGGDINFTGNFTKNGQAFLASPWSSNTSNAYLTGGLVGIGTSNPSAELHVVGTTACSNIKTQNITGTGASSNTINIGTDSNTSTINIGGNNSTVNISGVLSYITATDLNVADKKITLNKGGATATGNDTGFEIEEAGVVKGYLKTSSDRNSFLLRTPNATSDFTMNLGNQSVNLNNNTLVLSNSRIGVGTSNPAYNLEVAGVIHATSNILVNGQPLQAGYWLSTGSTINYTYSNVAIGSNTDVQNSKLYVANTGTTNQGASGDCTSTSNNAVTIYDANYPRVVYKSGDSNTSLVYNFESNKNVFWGENTDSGYYSFRGRNVAVGYVTPPSAGYKLDVNGTANVADKLNVANNISLGTTNTSEKLTLSAGNIAMVHAGAYGGQASTDKWISIGDKTQTLGPQFQQSNYGINMTWDTDGCFFGLRDFGSDRKDTVISFGDNSNDNLRFVNSNNTDYFTLTGVGLVGIGKSNPAYKLDVNGDINFTGTFRQNDNPYIGSQWSNTSNIVFLMSSNVGIGKSNPGYPLDVSGQANATTLSEGGTLLSAKYAPSNALSNYALLSGGTLSTTAVTTTTLTGSNASFSNLTVAGTLNVVSITDYNITGSNLTMNTIAASNQFFAPLSDSSNAPGYAWSNDTNTGFYHPSACNIAFVVGGIEKMRLTSTGALGVGKSNPGYALDVQGQANASSFSENGTSLTAKYALSNTMSNYLSSTTASTAYAPSNTLSNYVLTSVANTTYAFSNTMAAISATANWTSNNMGATSQWTTSSNKLFILGSNVGIGTSNPSCALQVSGDLQVDSNLILGNRAIQMQGIKILPRTGTGVANITSSVTSIPGYAYNSNLTFSPYTGCNVLVANGKLGVGTSNPTDTLTISGNNSGFTYDLTGNSILSNAPTTYGLKFLNSTLNYTNETTVDPTPNTLYGGILLRSYTTYAGTGIYNFENRANIGMGLVVRNGNSSNVEALSIDYTGKVGIGKSNPAYTLDVVGGTVAATTFYGSNANFSNVTVPGTLTVVNITDCNLVGSNIVMNKYYAANQFFAPNTDSVSAAGYSWSNDANTGLFHPTYCNIAMSIGGAEKVRLTATGLGVGKSNPAYLLDVSGDINYTGTFRQNGTAVSFGIGWAANTSNIYSNSNIGIGISTPSYPLHVSGAIYATGDIGAYSDARAKSELQVIDNALEKVNTLTGYTYLLKNPVTNVISTERHAGLIAQDVQKVLPEVVSEDNKGNLSLCYGNMVGLLVEAVKELTTENASLKATLSNILDEIAILKSVN